MYIYKLYQQEGYNITNIAPVCVRKRIGKFTNINAKLVRQ